VEEKPIAEEQSKTAAPAAPASTDAPTPTTQVRQRNPSAAVSAGDDFVKKLERLVNPADPTKLYRNLIKIGQG
jgi:hypothetical protein